MAQLPTARQLDELAHAVVLDGLDAHRTDVADLVAGARRLGIRPVLADVLADAGAPGPVRERALGLLLVALATHAAAPITVTTGAASAA